MNRLFVLAGVAAVAVVLALHRPPAPAAAITVSPQASQSFVKGHPARTPPAQSVVYVVGAVRHPGLYSLPANARVNDAIVRAGGFLPSADRAAVNLAERANDGAEVRVPRAGETVPPASRRPRSRKAAAQPPSEDLDLNEADAAALASLPGIGETLAARIVEYRGINGPFASLDELADVAGMTQRRIDAISPYLHVTAAR